MKPTSFALRGWPACLGLWVFGVIWVTAAVWVNGADPAFVGVLAIAAEDETANRLGLSEETRQKLLEVIDKRETEALNLALELKDLPPPERQARLAPFVSESERLGLALLTPPQRAQLQQLRVARAGMSTLVEPTVAQTLSLTPEQQAKIQQLVAEREQEMAKGGENERRAVRDSFERKLMEVLSVEQRANWEKLAGYAGVTPEASAKAPAAPGAAAAPSPAPAPAPTAPAAAAAPAGTPTSAAASPMPAQASPVAATEAADLPLPGDDVKLRFNFHYAPWQDVLDWFATQAGLSLQIDAPPPGTFNYKDPRAYSPGEAIDVLNSVLLTKGFTLLRRGRMLTLINVEDKVPDLLIDFTPLEELDERGSFELTKCIFSLSKMPPEQAETEIRKIIGPQGSVVVLAASRQIMVTETGAKLRAIRDMISRVEDPQTLKDQKITEIGLKHVTAEEVLEIARPLLSLPAGQNSSNDIRIAIDPFGARLLATGSAEMIQKLQEIVPLVDKDPSEDGAAPKPLEQPQLETYYVKGTDPAMTLKVMQTLLAGIPDVRLDMDVTSGKLIALARPAEHATIKATLKMLEGQGTQFETIQLRRTDPQLAVLTINKFFNLTKGGEGPIVDGDTTSMKLWVRGTPAQLAQIKDLIHTLEGGEGGEEVRTNLRMVPLSGSVAESVLEQADRLWTGGNRIRFVTPSSVSPSIIHQRPVNPPDRESAEPSSPAGRSPESRRPRERPPQPGTGSEPSSKPEASRLPSDPRSSLPARRPADTRLQKRSDSPFMLVAGHRFDEPADSAPLNGPDAAPASPSPNSSSEAKAPSEAESESAPGEDPVGEAAAPPAAGSAPKPSRRPSAPSIRSLTERVPADPNAPASPSEAGEKPARTSVPGSEIRVTVTPQGILVSSDDLDALDRYENLLRTLAAPQLGGGNRNFTVFYLKYAKADVAQQLIQEIMGGTSSSGSGSGGGSLLGDMASNMLGGGLLGGLMGGMMGGGGGGDDSAATSVQATGEVRIISDPRLNALMVYANPLDLETIEQLLQVIDREGSITEVQLEGVPRLIPVYYSSAADVAEVVKQVFANRLVATGGGGNQQQRQPSPEDFIRALRGGGGGRRGGGGNEQEGRGEPAKMTIGVDSRTNSIIVTAPEHLYQQVVQLVEQIDTEDAESAESLGVVTLKSTNAELVQKALSSVLGSSAKTNKTTASTTTSGGSTPTPGGASQPSSGGPSPEDIQRRMEFFQRMREQGGFGGRSFGGGPGGPPGSSGSSGSSQGSRGGGRRGGR